MYQALQDLLKDLEQYIKENWIGEEDTASCSNNDDEQEADHADISSAGILPVHGMENTGDQ